MAMTNPYQWVYLPGKLTPPARDGCWEPGRPDWIEVQDEVPAFSWLGAAPGNTQEWVLS